jgi:hypothetical protein
MTREEVIEKLVQFASPLGPFESLDARLRYKEEWITSSGADLVDMLLDLLTHPPALTDIRPATSEGFEFENSQLLALLGHHDPVGLLEKIGPLLTNNQARPTAIEVIGALQAQEGIRWLVPLVGNVNLTEDELIRLAAALGEIAGPDARLLLEQMRSLTSVEMVDVLREIDIALQSEEE